MHEYSYARSPRELYSRTYTPTPSVVRDSTLLISLCSSISCLLHLLVLRDCLDEGL